MRRQETAHTLRRGELMRASKRMKKMKHASTHCTGMPHISGCESDDVMKDQIMLWRADALFPSHTSAGMYPL